MDGSIGGKPGRYCHIELLFGEMYLMCINYMLLFILNSTGSGAHSLCIIPFLSKCIQLGMLKGTLSLSVCPMVGAKENSEP